MGGILSRSMKYRPLSKRDAFDPDLDTLHEEVEPWMVAPLIQWLQPFLWQSRGSRMTFITGFEMEHRVRQPFNRVGTSSAALDVEERIQGEGSFGLDVVNYALSRGQQFPDAEWAILIPSLTSTLQRSGSAWEVSSVDYDGEARFALTRRDLAAAKAAISEIRLQHERAGKFLTDAWKAVATRDPRPNEAYDKAVKAIEAAAQPVVSPDNDRATLGTIIRDMRAKPSKWSFPLGDLDPIIAMSDRVWTEHFRHGTDERRDDHTLEEADAALHLAIPLARFFAGGLISRT
jgi:hypothetical protein